MAVLVWGVVITYERDVPPDCYRLTKVFLAGPRTSIVPSKLKLAVTRG